MLLNDHHLHQRIEEEEEEETNKEACARRTGVLGLVFCKAFVACTAIYSSVLLFSLAQPLALHVRILV